MKQWTQEEAVAFESARECITDLIGICTAERYEERARATPDQARIDALNARITALGNERRSLTLFAHDAIQRVRTVYGAEIRAYREQHRRDGV